MQKQLLNIRSKEMSLNEKVFTGNENNRNVPVVSKSPAIDINHFLKGFFSENIAVNSVIPQNISHVTKENINSKRTIKWP